MMISVLVGLAVAFMMITIFAKLSQNSVIEALKRTQKKVIHSSFKLFLMELWGTAKCPHVSEKEILSSAILFSGLLALVALITFGSLIYAVLLGVLGFIYLPKGYMYYKRQQLKKEFAANLGAATSALSSSVRGGSQMLLAIQYTAEQLEGPVANEFAKLAEDVNSTTPLAEAAQNMAERVGTEEAQIFAENIGLLSLIGTSNEKSSRLLSAAANFVDERQTLKEKISAATSHVIFGFVICSIIPIGMAIGFYSFSPPYRLFFATGKSRLIVLIFAAFIGLGWYFVYNLKKRAEREI